MTSIRFSTFFLLLAFFLSSCLPSQIPVIASAKSGDLLYQEGFEDNTTGWARISNENGIMDYDNGGYRIPLHITW